MITFYKCFQEYYLRPDAIRFSKKQIKKMHHCIKFKYDNLEIYPVSYIEQQEGDQIYSVRVYPYSFKKVIVEVINRFHKVELEKQVKEFDKALLSNLEEVTKIAEYYNYSVQEISTGKIKEKKVRKKIPVKPVFSSKPK